jgi:hypothetical protein
MRFQHVFSELYVILPHETTTYLLMPRRRFLRKASSFISNVHNSKKKGKEKR